MVVYLFTWNGEKWAVNSRGEMYPLRAMVRAPQDPPPVPALALALRTAMPEGAA